MSRYARPRCTQQAASTARRQSPSVGNVCHAPRHRARAGICGSPDCPRTVCRRNIRGGEYAARRTAQAPRPRPRYPAPRAVHAVPTIQIPHPQVYAPHSKHRTAQDMKPLRQHAAAATPLPHRRDAARPIRAKYGAAYRAHVPRHARRARPRARPSRRPHPDIP